MTKTKLSSNTKAYLISEFQTNKPLIRIYDDKYDFIDYEILHPDLEITITDNDVILIEQDGNHYIDIDY